jgi:hypothetical protein
MAVLVESGCVLWRASARRAVYEADFKFIKLQKALGRFVNRDVAPNFYPAAIGVAVNTWPVDERN